MTSEPSQEERPGRGRAISRSPASVPPSTITPEDSSTAVHASQVTLLLLCMLHGMVGPSLAVLQCSLIQHVSCCC